MYQCYPNYLYYMLPRPEEVYPYYSNQQAYGSYYAPPPYDRGCSTSYPQGAYLPQNDQARYNVAPYANYYNKPIGDTSYPYCNMMPNQQTTPVAATPYSPFDYKVYDNDTEYVVEAYAYYGEQKHPYIITVVGNEIRMSSSSQTSPDQRSCLYRIPVPYGVNYNKLSAYIDGDKLKIYLPKYVEVIKPATQKPKVN